MAHLLIVGAGAAGLFAAGGALRAGHRVTLVEHMPRPGAKLAITGKGRCNLTNECTPEEFMNNVRHNGKYLYSALHALPPAGVMRFFEEQGLPLKTERGRRVFPQSDRADDVVDTLRRAARAADCVHGRAEALLLENGAATGLRLAGGRTLRADAVLVATGGLSYPTTGATGDGYRLAQQAGHSIVPPVPSLVSMVEAGNTARRMVGLSLRNVRLTLLANDTPVFSEQGEMLFTHFGISGPLTLSASAYLDDMTKTRYTVLIDAKPALSEEQLSDRMLRDWAAAPNREAAHCLDKLLPASMRPVVLDIAGIAPAQRTNQITREQRRRLVELIKALPIPIRDRGDLNHAVITAGGVDVREVDPKTMQSRLCSGLYFAGEVLDLDAYTGGYNLHIAWCTAHAAATHLQ